MNQNILTGLSVENILATGISTFAEIFTYKMLCLKLSKRKGKIIQQVNIYSEISFLSIVNLLFIFFAIIIVNRFIITLSKFAFVIEMQIFIVLLSISINFITVIKKNTEILKKQYQNQQLQRELNYYSSLQEATVKISTLRHDISNHIICIHEMLKKGSVEEALKYTNSLHQSIQSTKDVCELDNKLLSIILTEKFQDAKEKGIRVEKDIFPSLPFYSILNAMEEK